MKPEWITPAKARADFADMIESLTPEQLAAETLCEGWTAHEVAGHLVSFVEMSLPTLMMSMAKSRFDVNKAWFSNAKRYGAQDASEIVAKMRANLDNPSAARFLPPGVTTVDVAVHTQDIRRPLGLPGELDPAVLTEALDFCTSHKKSKMMVEPKEIAGLRLEATDIDWSWGSGALVSGPAEAILMGINRRDTRSELTGEGVSKLPTRSTL